MTLKAGERLGPYEILGLIGAGGMGEVYKAKDTRLDRTVAIKVLPDDISADPDHRARFEREAKTIAALSHPHICTLFDIGRHDGTDFLVMEHLDGQTLALRLQEGALPLEDALAIGIQIAHALDKAHRAGIVHRDLKPGNIMLTKSGAKLLDFGLAKARPTAAAAAATTVLATGQVPITAQGTILGTLKYMAPEQLDGKPADTRADIWAFGCVLYEMLTGTRAFDGSSPASVIGAIMSSSPRPVQELAPVAPPLLDRIVRGCLTKDPEERVQSTHDLRNDLRWIEELGTSAARPAAPSRSRRARVLVRAASALALAGVVGAAYLVGRQTRNPPEQIQFHVPAPEGLRFVTSHAMSPDGRHIVVVATDARDETHLWLQTLDAEEGRLLPRTEDASFPFWSPNSDAVAFFAGQRLKRIDISGGPPTVICRVEAGRGGAWDSDGQIVFAPTNTSPLMRVAASGGEPSAFTALSEASGDISHRFPNLLPGGRLVYYAMRRNPAENSVMVASARDLASAKQLFQSETTAAFAAGLLYFFRDDTLFAQRFDATAGALGGDPIPIANDVAYAGILGLKAFSVSANGSIVFRRNSPLVTELAWVARDGRVLQEVGSPTVQTDPTLSPDGTRLAIARHDGNQWDIWELDLERRTSTLVTRDAEEDSAPVWSADAARIVFSSRRGPGRNINLYMTASDGRGAIEPVFEGTASMSAGGWTADNQMLVWRQADVPPRSNIRTLAPDGRPTVLLDPGASLETPSVSRDGHLLAYTSNQSGRREVYVAALPRAAPARQVSTDGGAQPRWRRDGRELYYVSAIGELVAVPIGTHGETPVGGAPQVLFPAGLRDSAFVAQYDVSPDGTQFLVNRIHRQSVDPLTVILNWSSGAGARPRW